jgi:hypothetical protein
MKAKTFPWLLMQNNTFLTNQRNKSFFFYLNAHKAKKEKYQQVKTKKNFWPKRRSQRVTSKITHKKIKIELSHLSKNPIKENFEENF